MEQRTTKERILHEALGLFSRSRKAFFALIGVGVLKDGDVHSMSLQYVCPILILLSVCGREPERETEAMAQLEAHIRQFMSVQKIILEQKTKEV